MAYLAADVDEGTIELHSYCSVDEVVEEFNEEHGTEYDPTALKWFVQDTGYDWLDGLEVAYDHEDVLEVLETAEGEEAYMAGLQALLQDAGYEIESVDTHKLRDMVIFYGDLEDAAKDYVGERGDLPRFYEDFIDYQDVGDSMESNGDWLEVRFGYNYYVIQNWSAM
jgi:hypothetical protein